MMARRSPWMVAAALLLACGKDKQEGGDSGPAEQPLPDWQVPGVDLSSALLSITGSSAADVWAVGSDVGAGPMVLHFDGANWNQITTGTTGDLWWVWLGESQVWAVGAGGRVLRHAPGSTATYEEVLDPAVTLFGIWGSSESDIWTVGGDVSLPGDAARLWHHDGTEWTEVALPAEAAAGIALYKVWGTGPSDVWVVGTGGITMHYDGAAWSLVSSGTDRNLFTVHGDGEGLYAVGGAFSGTLLEGDGSTWTDRTPTTALQLNGVSSRAGCDPAAVGIQGSVWMRQEGEWALDSRPATTILDLHGAWVDPDCGIWAVGGYISSLPMTNGVVAYSGYEEISSIGGL